MLVCGVIFVVVQIGGKLMASRFGIVCGLGLALLAGGGPALALGPVNLAGPSVGAQLDVVDASFFGRPYPYGFTGWGPCVRYVEVETRWGPRLRRVWVCR